MAPYPLEARRDRPQHPGGRRRGPDSEVSRIALEAHGPDRREAASGAEGIAQVVAEQPELVSSTSACQTRTAKRSIDQYPCIVAGADPLLSVRQAEAEKVAALDAGANDFVVKPFGMAELLARVRALTRPSRATRRRPRCDRRPDRRLRTARSSPGGNRRSSSRAVNSTFLAC